MNYLTFSRRNEPAADYTLKLDYAVVRTAGRVVYCGVLDGDELINAQMLDTNCVVETARTGIAKKIGHPMTRELFSVVEIAIATPEARRRLEYGDNSEVIAYSDRAGAYIGLLENRTALSVTLVGARKLKYYNGLDSLRRFAAGEQVPIEISESVLQVEVRGTVLHVFDVVKKEVKL